uniref:Interleukin-5 n=2 Tax=Gallus gallus TaxID=9031 RepID=Q5W4T8_CHICK|nr:interleukin 5 precursor [Gallus gallus]CAF18430.1 interleukin-5 [Gallus gallus]CAF18544.1 interleukin-5 [Gallus gallus]|eukprot:NP_001007085.1 interleukin 5 precursor [Gallus gallus]
MRTHLYFLLLTVGISATPLRSNLAELQTWLQQIYQSVDMLVSSIFYFCSMNLRIETPVSADDENCIKTLFEGTALLKNNPEMRRFGTFFQSFDKLRPSLTAQLTGEGECDTERKNVKKFIEKLRTFIRKLSRDARV